MRKIKKKDLPKTEVSRGDISRTSLQNIMIQVAGDKTKPKQFSLPKRDPRPYLFVPREQVEVEVDQTGWKRWFCPCMKKRQVQTRYFGPLEEYVPSEESKFRAETTVRPLIEGGLIRPFLRDREMKPSDMGAKKKIRNQAASPNLSSKSLDKSTVSIETTTTVEEKSSQYETKIKLF